MSTRPRSPVPALSRALCLLAAAPLLAVACSSSGSGATSGGSLCMALQSSSCVGAGNCAGEHVCQADGESFGPCQCSAVTTGGKGTGTTGGTTGAGTSGTTGVVTTGGLVASSSGTTGGPISTDLIGTTITPAGPSTTLMMVNIQAINLDTTPQPGGTVNATGLWNSGTSSLTGTYNTASQVLLLSGTGYNASFTGMLGSGVIKGEWTGESYQWPFSLVPVPYKGKGYAFCGDDGTQSLGVAFATDGTLGAVDGPGPSAPAGGSGTLGGSYSNNLATVDTIGSFILSTDTDGGLAFTYQGNGWSMSVCR